MNQAPDREVNLGGFSDIEVITPQDEGTPEEDKDIVPPLEGDPRKNEPAPPSEPSPDGTPEPDETPPAPPDDEGKPQIPKPVEGETEREYALRKEVERLRREKREWETRQNLDKPTAVPQVNRLEELQKKYDPEQLKDFEELFEAMAESKGYKKAASYQDQANIVLETWIEAHPEYRPENDSDDLRWQAFNEELRLYKLPENAQKLGKIFDRIHENVERRVGKPQPKDNPLPKIEAAKQKIRSAGHGGSGGQTPAKPKANIDPSVRGFFKGFEDDDFVG